LSQEAKILNSKTSGFLHLTNQQMPSMCFIVH